MATSTDKIKRVRQAQYNMFGDNGLRYLTAAQSSPAGEDYFGVFANEAAVVTMTSARSGTTAITSMPIPAGSTVYGCFSGVTCTSGRVTCYLREEEGE